MMRLDSFLNTIVIYKRSLFLIIVFYSTIFHQTCYSQNLVPNPSFEDLAFCPFGFGQIYSALNWLNFGQSPDNYNSCAGNGMNVPNSYTGFQDAHSGNGRAGFINWRRQDTPTGPNTREFIGIQLQNPLTIGTKYFFSCYINFSNIPLISVACNKIGMKLTTFQIDSSQYLSLIDNNPHVYLDSIVSDSIFWTKISGEIIADSAYEYLILGNFFDDTLTDTISNSIAPEQAYYFIDDICLSTDSMYCDTWTFLSESFISSSEEIFIIPNPADNWINITSKELIDQVQIFNFSGSLISSIDQVKLSNVAIEVNSLSAGLYYLRIKVNSSIYFKKFIKI